jgi:hypothetical protein
VAAAGAKLSTLQGHRAPDQASYHTSNARSNTNTQWCLQDRAHGLRKGAKLRAHKEPSKLQHRPGHAITSTAPFTAAQATAHTRPTANRSLRDAAYNPATSTHKACGHLAHTQQRPHDARKQHVRASTRELVGADNGSL